MSRTLQSLVCEMGGRGDHPAIVAFTPGGAEEWSYRRLDGVVRRLAAGLMARGIAPGDRVAVISANRLPLVALRLALVAAGIIAVPLDDLAPTAELDHAFDQCDPKVLFVSPAIAEALADDQMARFEAVYILDDEGRYGIEPWTVLLADGDQPLPEIAPDDVTAVIYTSGTTGESKGVPLTHRNFLVNIDALAGGGFVGPRDRALMPLPLHHSYPFMAGLMVPIACGSTVVLPRGVTAADVADALAAARVTAMIGVPRLYEAMADGIRGRIAAGGLPARMALRGLLALSVAARRRLGIRLGRMLMRPVRARFAPDLRLLASGGARLDVRAAWFLEGLGFEVLSGYGLVETASVTTYNRRGRGRIGTEGLPVTGAEIRIDQADADGIGEILVRGPHVFAGYHQDPAATRAAFTAEGWFRTGDLGRLDGAGALVVEGRSKEVIVLAAGKNVGPEEVEAALAASPFIAEAAVLEHDGALVALVAPDLVALRQAETVRLDELIRVAVTQSCADLAPFKRVTGFRIWRGALPKTRLGKIQRFMLPDLYAAAERAQAPAPAELDDEDRALLDDPAARRIVALLQRRFPDAGVGLDTSPQLELGIDSLAWLELTQEIESDTGVGISTEALGDIVTVRDLLTTVVAEAGRAAPARSVEAPPVMAEVPEPRGPVERMAGHALYCVNWLLMRAVFRLRCAGPLPADDGPVLFVVNHASDIDAFMVAAALPWRIIARTWWSAEVTRVFNTPVRIWFARIGQIFPVDDRKPAESLRRGEAVLAKGNNLVWFPEAWRTPDGRLQPFARGVGIIANARRPRVCPVWVDGTFEVLPRHRRIPRLHPVRVVFGPTVAPESVVADATTEAAAAATAEALRALVAAVEPRPVQPR